MVLPKKALLPMASASLAIGTADAKPVAEQSLPKGVHLIETRDTAHGLLSFYGDKRSTNNTLQDRSSSMPCATEQPVMRCQWKHQEARTDRCDNLIAALKANSDVALGEQPRHVCINHVGQCCTSWAKVTEDFPTWGSLVPGAEYLMKKCGDPFFHKVSGKLKTKEIGNGCVMQCIAKQPKHCHGKCYPR